MTMSASQNVPRWMRDNRSSRESYVRSYGYGAVNPATQVSKANSGKSESRGSVKSMQGSAAVKPSKR